MASATDIAVVGWAQTPATRRARESEVQLLVPIVTQALERAGLDRREVGFTCAGSCDYLTGGPFAFVSNLEAAGAWPPISESHVEMDGAWALYEAWVRLQHGDIDTALVFGSGKSSPSKPDELVEWLTERWQALDDWIDEQRAGPRVDGEAVPAESVA